MKLASQYKIIFGKKVMGRGEAFITAGWKEGVLGEVSGTYMGHILVSLRTKHTSS